MQLEGWTWAAAFHWILGIPFVLLLVARHEGQVLFAQFFLYSQLAPLPYLLNWVSAVGAGGRRGLWYAGLFAFTALYLAVIGLSYSRLIVPMLSSGLSRILRSWSLFWMAPYAVFIVIAFGCYFLEQAGETAFLILYITLLNLLFAFIYLILKSVLLESKEALQAEMEAKNMGILVRQYEEVMERQESMRRFRHDQRHFLRTVNGLLYEENLEGLKRLICQYGEMLDEILTAIPIVNLVVLLIWSFGSSVSISKRNWARAKLILVAVSTVISVLALIGLFGVTAYFASYGYSDYGYGFDTPYYYY